MDDDKTLASPALSALSSLHNENGENEPSSAKQKEEKETIEMVEREKSPSTDPSRQSQKGEDDEESRFKVNLKPLAVEGNRPAGMSASQSMISVTSTSLTGRQVSGIEDGTLEATDGFWVKVSEMTNVKQIPKKAAIMEVVVDGLISERGGKDRAMLYVLKEYYPEFRVRAYTYFLLQIGASSSASDDDLRTGLHIATEKNYKSVIHLLLQHDALSLARDRANRLAVDISLCARNDDVCTLLVKAMPKAAVRELFMGLEEEESRHSFHKLIDDPEKMPDTILAVLDCMIEPIEARPDWFRLYYQILDGDSAGRSPKNPHFDSESRSCLQIIARSNNKEAVYHDVVRLLLKRKWKEFAGTIYKMRTVMFFINVVALTFAFVSAGSVDDPNVYASALDYARGVAEVVVTINVLFSLMSEINQMRKHKKNYIYDTYNYLDLASIFLLITVLPLRIAGRTEQWTIASLAYFTTVLISFKYAAAYRAIGQYTQIVSRIVRFDMVRFSILFLVFLFAFSGSLFLALRGEEVMMTSNGTTSNLNLFRETSTYGQILLTGLRILIQQESIVHFYGDPPEFGWLGVLLMLVFMFIIIVLLLNLLIAQLSDTFQNVQSDAQRELEINRAGNVARIEKNSLIFRNLRQKYYQEVEDIEDPKGVLEKWEVPPISNVSKKLNRMEEKLEEQDKTLEAMRSQLSRISSLLQLQLQSDVVDKGSDVVCSQDVAEV
eukprot:m.21026 g.21026  ORF g.21026 m.21026 type:complete len:720 (+) comp28127_c0_seq6:46-2205(+)